MPSKTKALVPRAAEIRRAVLDIENWNPPSVNRLLKVHWAIANRIKKHAKAHVWHAAVVSRPPVTAATGRRRVSVRVTVAGRGGVPDPDNILKALFDALKHNGLIVDDSATWLEIGEVTVERGKARRTVVTLEDI